MMLMISFVNRWLIIFIIGQASAVFYNQPKLCPNATWNPNAITFVNESMIGTDTCDAFVDLNNTLYVASSNLNQVNVWSYNNNTPIRTISAGLSGSRGIFVTNNGDIYVHNAAYGGRVEKWTSNATSGIPVMNVTGRCISLFIDINNTLYCANDVRDMVFKISLDRGLITPTIAAGNGTRGSQPNTLYSPSGIFVDFELNLYVADWGNNRIQRFWANELNGTVIVGAGAPGTITLVAPTDVVLDFDDNLFITDSYNHRVVRSGPTGSHCIVGCTNISGTASNQLNHPQTVVFDSYGNLFVVDLFNNRIQKFLLMTNSCDSTTTEAMTTKAIATTTEAMTTKAIATTTEAMTTKAIATTTAIQVQLSTISISNQNCIGPLLSLTPAGSSFLSPIAFRRNEDLSASSNIQLRCNNSLGITTTWAIQMCISNCSTKITLDQSVATTFSELFLPARTLSVGLYQLTLTVTMKQSSQLTSSSSVYVRIIPSGIQVNLVQLATSMITRGYAQNLTLNPGAFSIDFDGNIFNTSEWNYQYYCRILGYSTYPIVSGVLLPIEDRRIDPLSPSCLSSQSQLVFSSLRSSLTIFSQSLSPNQTYQFLVQVSSRRNSSIQFSSSLLVQITEADSQIVLVACVISTMCASKSQYQRVNPTTQVALYSLCLGTCTSINNIIWNIYQGTNNASSSMISWAPFNQTNRYDNIWFFGRETTNFTTINRLFLENPRFQYWRFEVVYFLLAGKSSGSIDFALNQPPTNGFCSINPPNGTTSTLFSIICSNWLDSDGIKDYSFYIWTDDRSESSLVSFTLISNCQLRLPAGNDNTSLIHLFARIRDRLGAITEYNMSSIMVLPDTAAISNLMDTFQSSSTNNNPLVELLVGGNVNTVGQVVGSISQVLNTVNTQNFDKAVSSGISASSISISSLDSDPSPSSSVPLNESVLNDFNQQINTQANLRDYLMTFTQNLLISSANSIELQASSLAQLTGATNQLTRNTALLASRRCQQLAVALHAMRLEISYESVKTAASQISTCATNVLGAINGPLQGRTNTLQLDSIRANVFPEDYEADLEGDWANLNLFAEGDDFSSETIEKNRNIYYQKQAAKEILNQVTKTMRLLTAALNAHLNIGQNLSMSSSSMFVSLQTQTLESISNKIIQQPGRGKIRIPTNFTSTLLNNQTISLQSMMEPLAVADQSQTDTNLSRIISLTVLDQDGNEVSIQTNSSNPFELIIPRDPNTPIPPMILQDVLSTSQHQFFNLHYVNITSTLTISVHLEIQPLDSNVSYLLIYKFDGTPQLTGRNRTIDGWTVFCSSDWTNETIYKYFLDNEQTAGHRSMVFGLRQLNPIENCSNLSLSFDPPIINEKSNFTSNYQLRVYSSGCYYLDENDQWKSDGMKVGPLTNHRQTQCFSTHL